VNNRAVTGSIELRDLTLNEDGTLSSTKKLVGLTITFPNGESVSLPEAEPAVWTDGVRDGDPSNNNVSGFTGSVDGVWSNGSTFRHRITVEPIVSDWSCAADQVDSRGLLVWWKLNVCADSVKRLRKIYLR
jgi:hypothetical protein